MNCSYERKSLSLTTQIRTARSLRDSLSKFCRSANFKKPEWFSRYSEYSMDWTVRGSNPRRKKKILQNFQAGSGVHPTPCLVGSGGSFSGVKWPTRKVNQAPPSSVEVKNEWSYTSTPSISFLAWLEQNFTFLSHQGYSTFCGNLYKPLHVVVQILDKTNASI